MKKTEGEIESERLHKKRKGLIFSSLGRSCHNSLLYFIAHTPTFFFFYTKRGTVLLCFNMARNNERGQVEHTRQC